MSNVYTVKSSSKFLAEENFMIPLASNQSQDNDLWKLIWGLSIPNKVSNFLWHSRLNAILSKQIYREGKFHPTSFVNIVRCAQKPCLMHYGSVQSSRIFGVQFQRFHFNSHALFLRSGKEWSCGLYGIEETNSKLVPRIFLSCR